MQKSIASILEPLAERCIALAAGMLASTIETLHIEYRVEQQNRLEELARSYEADGRPEAANAIRERLRILTSDNPAAYGEFLLRQLTQLSKPGADSQEDWSRGVLSVPSSDPNRRPTTRSRRPKRVSLSEPPVTETPCENASLQTNCSGPAPTEEAQ